MLSCEALVNFNFGAYPGEQIRIKALGMNVQIGKDRLSEDAG